MRAVRYFGCALGFPPGDPGGGMTRIAPPAGGRTRISESTPAGGQITPLESASWSLSGLSWFLPMVGAFAPVPGGHDEPG